MVKINKKHIVDVYENIGPRIMRKVPLLSLTAEGSSYKPLIGDIVAFSKSKIYAKEFFIDIQEYRAPIGGFFKKGEKGLY